MHKNYKYFFIILIIIIIIFLFFIKYYWIWEGFTENFTAVIVEPRKHKALSFVIKNALENLPDKWNIIIMHGNLNKDYVFNIMDELPQYKDRMTAINLNVDNLTISEYNDLLTSKEFYEKIPTEIFLIFQTDSVICDENKHLLDDFMIYDYVGAPWKDAVGNGGFSLRKKSKTLETISKCKRGNDKENEDIFFANPCINIYKPSIEKAKLFSTESIYSPESFGVHKPWAYLNDEEMNHKIEKCRSLKTLWELNK